MSSEKIIEELTRDVMDLKREVERLARLTPLYMVLNENSPAQITGNQNNYDPGNYSVLRLTADAARNITGIAGGVKGRWLLIYVAGSFTITFVDASALSDAQNRITTPTGANLALAPVAAITMVYDINNLRWRVVSFEL